MEILTDRGSLGRAPRGGVLTIGNFDGVHRGHQAILRAARRIADQNGVPLCVMTFDPHPMEILHPERVPGVLTPLAYKGRLLELLGVNYLLVIHDSLSLLNLSPKDFIDQFLMAHLAPRAVVEGPNFNFGYGRSGTLSILRTLGAERGFDVTEVPFTEFYFENDPRAMICSSSIIRDLLEKGRVLEAERAMGRPYRLIGRTTPGRGIGKTLGFPTANIRPLNQVIPSDGVYAGYAVIGRTVEEACQKREGRPAALSIGRAKTFAADYPLLLEAHILEEEVEDLRDQYLAMDFIHWLRGQRRFDTVEQLKSQIAQDCRDAEKTLNSRNHNR